MNPAYVTQEELRLFREDPQREQKMRILDYVICRKCGAKLCMIFKRHLLKDGYASDADYQREWQREGKDAPIYSLWDEAKKHNWYFNHKPKVIADATQWNDNHPKRHKKHQKTYRGTAKGKQKAKDAKTKHLAKIKAALDFSTANWRPADWWEMPLDWRIIGGELLSQTTYMSNADLGERLDAGRIIKCPYGPKDSLWEDVLSSDRRKKVKAAIKLITEIRKWVGRPGRNFRQISGQATLDSPRMRLF